MKLLSYILFLIVITSCHAQKPISFDFSQVEKIEVYQGYPGTKVKMKDGFEKEFIFDLNESKNVGPTKYMKTHIIQIKMILIMMTLGMFVIQIQFQMIHLRYFTPMKFADHQMMVI